MVFSLFPSGGSDRSTERTWLQPRSLADWTADCESYDREFLSELAGASSTPTPRWLLSQLLSSWLTVSRFAAPVRKANQSPVLQPQVKGIKVMTSGCLGGADMSGVECYHEGLCLWP